MRGRKCAGARLIFSTDLLHFCCTGSGNSQRECPYDAVPELGKNFHDVQRAKCEQPGVLETLELHIGFSIGDLELITRDYCNEIPQRLALLAKPVNTHQMNIYRVKIGFHNPSALTFRQLDEVMAMSQFSRKEKANGLFRYCVEYEISTEQGDLCSVCSLAYAQACTVRKCPLVLVEEVPTPQS